ncbi:nipblb [Symbiodinium necroappetens]|uniref:Nipblb protein n=1 Tax=Symbiodinium necroappetens TaxID=1628268 RepID=A0A812JXP0_9DINO|nr:nipblb [Symbiodinium necroappetens]
MRLHGTDAFGPQLRVPCGCAAQDAHCTSRPKLEKSLPKKAHVTLPADSVLWLHHTGSGDAEEHKQDKQAMVLRQHPFSDMRLPKVKNKHTATVQVSAEDLIPGPPLSLSGERSAASEIGPSKLEAAEEALALQEFKRERQEVKSASEPTRIVFKTRARSMNLGVRATLRVRRSDWAKRRLLCIAICKEDACHCPLAKLPQGFLRFFVDHVFSFLADGFTTRSASCARLLGKDKDKDAKKGKAEKPKSNAPVNGKDGDEKKREKDKAKEGLKEKEKEKDRIKEKEKEKEKDTIKEKQREKERSKEKERTKDQTSESRRKDKKERDKSRKREPLADLVILRTIYLETMRQVVLMLCMAAGAAGDTESSDADVTNLLQLISPLPDASGAHSHLHGSDFTSPDDKWSTPALTVKAVKPATRAKIVVTERHLASSQRTAVPTIRSMPASLAEPAQLAHLGATKPKVRNSKALAVKATKKVAPMAHAKKATKAKKAKKKSDSQPEAAEEVKQGVPQRRKAKKAPISKEVLVKTSPAVQKHQAISQSRSSQSQESLQAAASRKACRDFLQECRMDLKVDACLRYKSSCLAGAAGASKPEPELVESQAVGQSEPGISQMADPSQAPAGEPAAEEPAAEEPAAEEPAAEPAEPTPAEPQRKQSADALDNGISQSGVGGFGTDAEPEPVEVPASEDVTGPIAEEAEAEEAEAEAAESSEQDATEPEQSVSPTAEVPEAEEAEATEPDAAEPAQSAAAEAAEAAAPEQDATEPVQSVSPEADEAEAEVAEQGAMEAEAAEAPEQDATEPMQSVSPVAEAPEAEAEVPDATEQDATEAGAAEVPEQDATEPVQSVSPAAEAPEAEAEVPDATEAGAAPAPERNATEPAEAPEAEAEAPEAPEAPEQDAMEPKSEADGVETEPVDGEPATSSADRVLEPEVPVKAEALKSGVSEPEEAAPIGLKSQAMSSVSDPPKANAAWVFGQAASTLTNNQEVGLQSTTFGLTRVDALGTSAGSLTLAQRELENQRLTSVKENLCALWHTMCGRVATAEMCVKYAGVCQ